MLHRDRPSQQCQIRSEEKILLPTNTYQINLLYGLESACRTTKSTDPCLPPSPAAPFAPAGWAISNKRADIGSSGLGKANQADNIGLWIAEERLADLCLGQDMIRTKKDSGRWIPGSGRRGPSGRGSGGGTDGTVMGRHDSRLCDGILGDMLMNGHVGSGSVSLCWSKRFLTLNSQLRDGSEAV